MVSQHFNIDILVHLLGPKSEKKDVRTLDFQSCAKNLIFLGINQDMMKGVFYKKRMHFLKLKPNSLYQMITFFKEVAIILYIWF